MYAPCQWLLCKLSNWLHFFSVFLIHTEYIFITLQLQTNAWKYVELFVIAWTFVHFVDVNWIVFNECLVEVGRFFSFFFLEMTFSRFFLFFSIFLPQNGSLFFFLFLFFLFFFSPFSLSPLFPFSSFSFSLFPRPYTS